MKKYINNIIVLSLIIIILIFSSSFSSAAYQIPEYISVGLYFTDPSVHVNTALPSFNVNAVLGLQIGFFKDNVFYELYNEPTSSTLTVRKDTYFTTVNGALREYDPLNNTISAGDKYGPYHTKIGADYPDSAAANAQAIAFRQIGLQAYPVFADTWQVWTGSYIDEATAQLDIINNIRLLLGDGIYTVIPPMGNRIVVTDAVNKIMAIFGSDSAYFQVKPRSENNPNIFSINDKKYRGSLEVKRLTASDMTVTNVISMQEYLYGNVPPEIGGNTNPEALKAQATASKMYAINNLGKHKKTGFDLCATTNCQVYKGYGSEVPACNQAIDSIKDKVVTYNNKLAGQIFYFASSAGRTEDAQNVWGYAYPYLKSVEDKYERIYTWKKVLRASDVKAKIPNIGNIMGMSIMKTSETGRVTQLAVRGDKRIDPAVYTLERCRTVFSLDSQLYSITTDADVYTSANVAGAIKTQLGAKKVISAEGIKTISSTNNKVAIIGAGGQQKSVAMVPETYTFTGQGWGHAVGLSQEGAIGMGKAGILYNEIIEHYFPGTKVE